MKYFETLSRAGRLAVLVLSLLVTALMFFYGPMSAMPLDWRIGTLAVFIALGHYMAYRAPYVPNPAEAPAKRFIVSMLLGFVIGMAAVAHLSWNYSKAVPVAGRIAVLVVCMLIALRVAVPRRKRGKERLDLTKR